MSYGNHCDLIHVKSLLYSVQKVIVSAFEWVYANLLSECGHWVGHSPQQVSQMKIQKLCLNPVTDPCHFRLLYVVQDQYISDTIYTKRIKYCSHIENIHPVLDAWNEVISIYQKKLSIEGNLVALLLQEMTYIKWKCWTKCPAYS